MPLKLLPSAERAARFALRAGGIRSRRIRTATGPIHAYDARGGGALPPVVLLHGLASTGLAFAPVLFALRPHVRRVVVPELPGHGASPLPKHPLTPSTIFDSVAAALDALGSEPFILVGNSLGGGLAARYAIERPDRVRGLVLASPAAAPPSDDEWRSIVDAFALEKTADGRAFLERIYHRPPRFAGLLARELVYVSQRRSVRDLLALTAKDDFARAEDLGALTMPLLLTWGRSERLLPPSSLAFLRRHLPAHAEIEEPQGVGHCPHIETPRAFAARILEFTRRHAG